MRKDVTLSPKIEKEDTKEDDFYKGAIQSSMFESDEQLDKILAFQSEMKKSHKSGSRKTNKNTLSMDDINKVINLDD